MATDIDELKERLRLGEDSTLEFKAVAFDQGRMEPHPDSLANEIAAFANSKGGTLLLGVDDKTREVTGIDPSQLDLVEQQVVNAAQNLADPPILLNTRKLELPDAQGTLRPLLRVDVPRSLFVHRSPRGYLYRIGSTRRMMSTEYLARMLQQRSQARLIRFDEQVVAAASLDQLVPELWQRFQTQRTREDRDSLLVKLGMARTDEDGVIRPTVSGVLMATRDPRAFMPNAFIQAVAYRGSDVVPEGPRNLYQLDAKDISGPLDAQIMEACRFVLRNMRVAAFKAPGRRDIPQYHMAAVFEALVNACAHRDYAVYESKIRLRMFSDRLELYSPGPIANTMTLDMLPYRQAARNENLASLLSRCPLGEDAEWLQTDRQTLMDRRGEGVRIILDDSEELSGKRPEYRLLDDSELMLTLFAATPENSI